jgi:hypothetical protein
MFSYEHSRPVEFLKEAVENALRSAVATVSSTITVNSSLNTVKLDNTTGDVDSVKPVTVAEVVNALLSDRGERSLHNLAKACGISIVGVDISTIQSFICFLPL